MQKPENVPVTFAKNDVEIIARETLYSGFFQWNFTVSGIVCLTVR
ncbi:ADP-ribose pyrophosphatase [Enterobacter hormaechei]|nr:ADP-ribose pyrophosphatase [Enterobacter hormaechei]